MLSRNDIISAIAEGHLKIYPFEEKNFTGIGYNLSTTNFSFSTNRGVLLTIYSETSSAGESHYVNIPPNDTILLFSKEYIEIDETLAGTFHSKVSRACQGLGHISTTLDPTWKGQLIIALNNPTSQEIRFELDKNSGNIMTMLLYQLKTPVTGKNIHDNNQGRGDVLLGHFSEPVTDKRYREKHLQLKAFVTGDFVTSLNGDDNFLTSDQPADKYSQKIAQLIILKDQLKRDLDILQEGRYSLGRQGGSYAALKSTDDVSLLKSCILYNIKRRDFAEQNLNSGQQRGRNRDFLELSKLVDRDHSWEGIDGNITEKKDLQTVISQYIDIISYELSMIEHIRRIKWQNKKILEYAGQGSEYDQFLKAEEKKRQNRNRLKSLLPVVPFIILFIVVAIISRNDPNNWVNICGMIAIPMCSIVTSAVTSNNQTRSTK